ncbi:hypothetical protein [sulfur-oxidizing endosymbiont of Gigantopelta aegis]|uniref:hypothetical protein n=1 Tax=sulfur-oxidizing endosymbiont of Gigantopelta aegis TaxID=2794934 RepID=UPI0018DB5328|nr:hypothetical protein [sulfur-oxidizing endosymbiont of Gigantopelta aegis]
MCSKWRILSFFLVSMGLIPIILLMGFFIPGVQKYLIEEPLQPFIAELGVSEISAETLYISPFSIEIKQLHVQYEGIEISINQLDSEFSPFSLLSNRIKINQLIADQIIINDQSLAMPADDSKSLPFYGLFPYFDSGFVYEIKRLDIQAQYTSKVTGFVQLSLIALDVDENTQNPIVLKIDAQQLTAIPNIKGLSLNASIALRQQTDAPVNAQQSFIDLVLTQTDNSKQFISTQLTMSQLAKPDKWQSFPFTNKRNNYLKERLHPEAIELQITHSDEQNKQLALVKYKGRYDGNEGIISGDLKLQIAKDFTQQLKPLSLPDIDGFMEAKFAYNIRSNEGNIKLINEFNVSHYVNKKDSSLPKKIEIFSHLSAQLDDSHLQVKRLFLDLISNNKKYINIFTHKALSIQLDNLSAFISQENSELFQFNINQLPLKWLNDFIPEQIIQEGILDTEINLAIEDKALKLITKRPINIHNLSIIEKNSPDAEEHHQQHLQQTALLFKQNISSDLAIHLDENNFNATIKKLSFFHHDKVQNNNPIQQLSSSIKLNIKSPMTLIHATNPPIDYTLETDGDINLLAISKLPLFSQKEKELSQEISLTELSSTLPKAIALKYAFAAQGNAATINLSHAEVSLNAGNSPKQSKTIISLIAAPNINIQLNATKNEQFKLLTSGKLLTAKVQNFKFNWLSPIIQQVTAPYTFSGQLAHLDMTLSAQNKLDEPSYSVDISTLKFSDLKAFEDKQGLFEDINIHSKIQAHYANNQLSIHYPSLKIFKNKTQLLNNSGKISINNLNAKDKSKQHISISGKLDSYLEQLMRLKLVNYYTKKKAGLTQPSILNARYQLKLQHNNLTINQSKLTISHPESQGKLVLTTHKAITLSLKDKQHNFSQDGHLSFELINFDLKPYETIFPQTQVSFQYANGLFDLIQTKKHQRIVLQKPFKIHNIRIAHKNKTIFNPFDLNLDFSAQQHKNIAQGEIKKLSIQFIDNKDKKEALSLQANFQLDMDKEIILQKLDGSLDLLITQLLKQPGVMPHNTLAQGSMQTQFSLTNNQLKHHWSIKNLVDNKGEQLVEAITIEGTGQIKNKHNFSLNLPIVMQSVSGTSQLDFKTQTSIHNKNTQVDMSINGHDVFLNDLLKLLAAIDPHTDNEDEDHIKEDKKKSPAQQAPTLAKGLDKTPAKKPFWRSGVDYSGPHCQDSFLKY